MSSSITRLASAGALTATLVLALSGCTSTQSTDPKASMGHPSAASMPNTPTSNPSVTSTLPGASTQNSGGSSAASPLPSAGSTPGNSGSGNSGLVTGSVGQNLSTNQYTVKVNAIKDPVQPSDSFETPDAGKRYVDINLTVTNKGNKKLIVDDYDVKATLTDNTTPTNSFVSGVGTPLSSDGLYQGDTTTGDVIFQVPTGVNLKYLDINFDPFTINGSQTVRVKVNN